MLGPVYEALSEKYAGKAVFVKVNIDDDDNQSVAVKYGITSIPNVLVFKSGVLADNSLGFVPQAALEAVVERNL